MGSNSSKNNLPHIENLDYVPFFQIVFNKKYNIDGVYQLLNHFSTNTLFYIRKVLIRHLSTSINLNPKLFIRLSKIIYYLNNLIDAHMILTENINEQEICADNSIVPPPPYE